MTVNLDQAPVDDKKYTVIVYTRKLSKSVLIVSLKKIFNILCSE